MTNGKSKKCKVEKLKVSRFIVIVMVVPIIACFEAIAQKEEGALVVISVIPNGVKKTSLTQIGFGAQLTLRNVESEKLYDMKPVGSMSDHCLIENLPEGKYQVIEIKKPIGHLIYTNGSSELVNFFSMLEFKNGQSYYLGNFHILPKVEGKYIIQLQTDYQRTLSKLAKKLTKKGIELSGDGITNVFPYAEEEFSIYFTN